MRLDIDLDGTANCAYQLDVEADPLGPKNPFENAFSARPQLLKTEQQARANLSLESRAHLEDSSIPAVKNAVGEPVAYRFMPGDNCVPVRVEERLVAQAGRVRRTTTSGSRRSARRSGTPPETTPTRARAATACRAGPRPTARSRTPTSCSGTPSATPISPAPRTTR